MHPEIDENMNPRIETSDDPPALINAAETDPQVRRLLFSGMLLCSLLCMIMAMKVYVFLFEFLFLPNGSAHKIT